MRPLIWFHWSSGVRVALRINALMVGIVVFVFGSTPLPRVTLQRFVIGTTSSRALVGQRLLFVMICAGLAAVAVPRVTLGSAGWMRSLPISGRATRGAAALALVGAQAAGFVFLALALPMAALIYRVPLSWALLAGEVVAIPAIATATVPSRLISRTLAAAAVVLAIMGTGAGLAGAVLLVAIATALPGGMRLRGRGAFARERQRRAQGGTRTGAALWQRMLWRDIGARRAAVAAFGPAILCVYAYFILRHNPDLSSSAANTVIRWCGGLALVLVATGIANGLAVTRQPWPWARSLPWSSSQRVFMDARLIALPLAVVVAREAVARERRLRVTAWRELGHDARSDPLWSGASV